MIIFKISKKQRVNLYGNRFEIFIIWLDNKRLEQKKKFSLVNEISERAFRIIR